jgi:hypothetical protein
VLIVRFFLMAFFTPRVSHVSLIVVIDRCWGNFISEKFSHEFSCLRKLQENFVLKYFKIETLKEIYTSIKITCEVHWTSSMMSWQNMKKIPLKILVSRLLVSCSDFRVQNLLIFFNFRFDKISKNSNTCHGAKRRKIIKLTQKILN